MNCQRWNMLHPDQPPRRSYLEQVIAPEQGPFVADTRANLRRFFEVDAESTVIATLYALARKGEIPTSEVTRAIQDLDIDPEKAYPEFI